MDEIAALAKKYGWLPCELEHARSSNESIYFKECIVPLVNGRSIHCPAFPEECDYVRIVQDGYELAYWHVDEWAEAPAEVMGAILGAAAGRKP